MAGVGDFRKGLESTVHKDSMVVEKQHSKHHLPPSKDVDYDEVPEEDIAEEPIHQSHVVKHSQPAVRYKRSSSRNGKGSCTADGCGTSQKRGPYNDEEMYPQSDSSQQSHQESDSYWGRFRFQTLPSNRGDSGHRSSSSSNPTLSSNVGEVYSNLGDLYVGRAFVGESHRRHSFTEGDDLILIQDTGARCVGDSGNPKYNNLNPGVFEVQREQGVAGQEEALYTRSNTLVASLNLEIKGSQAEGNSRRAYYNVPVPGGARPAAMRGVAADPKAQGVVVLSSAASAETGDSEDYMNEDPEGLFHTYHNHKELLEQLQAGNSPMPEPALQSSSAAVPGGEKKIAVRLRNFISKTPFLKKTPSEIHSQTISDVERLKTLQPFTLSGGAQAGRDYDAFFKVSAWGAAEAKRTESSVPSPSVERPVMADSPRRPDLSRITAVQSAHKKPLVPERPPRLFPSSGATPSQTEDASQTPSRHVLPSHHPPDSRPPFPVPSVPDKPSQRSNASSPQISHRAVGLTKSVDQPPILNARDHKLSSHTPAKSNAGSRDPPETGGSGPVSSRRQLPPPRPPPYISKVEERNKQKISAETKVRSLMPYWYRPTITREEAIGLVRQMDSGAFIVRDSQTVSGGYALTIKVSEAIVRQRKKLGDAVKVTDDMCVTHFLIQPDPEGVKLQGWNERAFKSLAEFITHHTVDKLCLPCKLVLPKPGGRGGQDTAKGRGRSTRGLDGAENGAQVWRRPVTMQQALKTGAACDLVYLGSVDVTGPGSAVMLAETIQQRKLLDIAVSVVTFKAAKEGLTISDNVSGLYIKRQYPLSSITYCGGDPNDTRWDFPHLQHLGESIPVHNAPCFGVFTRLPDSGGHTCLLFAQYSQSQPVTSVLSFLHQVMQQKQ